jgi:hypothetical protein
VFLTGLCFVVALIVVGTVDVTRARHDSMAALRARAEDKPDDAAPLLPPSSMASDKFEGGAGNADGDGKSEKDDARAPSLLEQMAPPTTPPTTPTTSTTARSATSAASTPMSAVSATPNVDMPAVET